MKVKIGKTLTVKVDVDDDLLARKLEEMGYIVQEDVEYVSKNDVIKYLRLPENNTKEAINKVLKELNQEDLNYGLHTYKTEELYNAKEDCLHVCVNQAGGGVRCIKCDGWFCY